MTGKIYLYEELFERTPKTIFESESFSAEIFKYSTGVSAVTIENSKGYITSLPFMGQMIWDTEFLGRNMVMKSIFDEPEFCREAYGESYGCFLMHCGLTAVGIPSEGENHARHGELPFAKYRESYILLGEDDGGKYISIGGVYGYKRAYVANYDFTVEYKLYEDASTFEIITNIKNKKDSPLEYFYLSHINYAQVIGSQLRANAKARSEEEKAAIPSAYPDGADGATLEYLKSLEADPSKMDVSDENVALCTPEFSFLYTCEEDKDGFAHTLEIMPDGHAFYVRHRPEELPVTIRWIGKTGDEASMGMVLPSTAPHTGYKSCVENGYARYLASGEDVTFCITAGVLSPEETKEIEKKI